MKIENALNVFQVGRKVSISKKYELFLCQQEGTGRQCLFQISTQKQCNGEISRVAFILGELKERADLLEAEYAEDPKNEGKTLGYDLGFPELLDSFVYQEEGLHVNVFAFREVESVHKMVPIITITEKYGLRVDLRTSGWIMGKTLKMIDMAHAINIAVGLTRGNNILIEKDMHYVNLFDWIEARIFSGKIPFKKRRQDISRAAQAVITVLGGDWKKGFIPDDGEKAFAEYSNFLLRLARGGESNSQRAHENFYAIVNKYWKREFHPFTTKKL